MNYYVLCMIIILSVRYRIGEMQMDLLTEFRATRILQDCRKSWTFLAVSCLAGALAGVLISNAVGNHYFLLMRMATGSRVSIVGLAASIWIPFLVSVIFIVHSKPWFACLICTLHITDFVITGYTLAVSFAHAGWLTGCLMQFSDICLIPALLYLCAIRILGKQCKRMVIYLVVFAIVVGMIHYSLISPFLANLIEDYETMGRYAIHVGLDQCL